MIENLKYLRQKKGWSQKRLAEALSLSQQSINKYENHDVEPDIEILMRMADLFDTSVDFLIGHSTVECAIEPVETYDLNEEEGELIERFRRLSKGQKLLLRELAASYREDEAAK